MCRKLRLPIDDNIIEELATLCDANHDGQIDYNEFINFLNWTRRGEERTTLRLQIDPMVESPATPSRSVSGARTVFLSCLSCWH